MTTYRFIFTVSAEIQREKFIKDNVSYFPSHNVLFISENMTPVERSWVSALWFNGANEKLFLDGKAHYQESFEQFDTYNPTLKEILLRWINTNESKPEYLEKAGIADEWWGKNGRLYRTTLMFAIALGVPFTFDFYN